jgi:hypothetical protein
VLPAILGATIGEDPVDADIVRVEERDHPVVEDVGRRQWRRPGALRSAWLRAPASGPTDPSRPSDHVKTSALMNSGRRQWYLAPEAAVDPPEPEKRMRSRT